MLSRKVEIASLSILVGVPSVASAQSNLYSRVWTTAASSIVRPANEKVKIDYWGFKRPLSFSIIVGDQSGEIEKLVYDNVIRRNVDEDCIRAVLKQLEGQASKDSSSATAEELRQIEESYLKEKGLKSSDLDNYISYKNKYNEEIKRISALSKSQAEAESYKLKGIETDWDLFGRRKDFAGLEVLQSKLVSSKLQVDVKQLRSEIYDGASEQLRFRISVPVVQWNKFDAWIRLRRRTTDLPKHVELRTIDIGESKALNDDRCHSADCQIKYDKTIINDDDVSISAISPQIDLPWLSKFKASVLKTTNPDQTCTNGWELDRLFLVRRISVAYSQDRVKEMISPISDKKGLFVDEILFAGVPDAGVSYFSSPAFEDGLLVSPYYFLLGFSAKAAVKP